MPGQTIECDHANPAVNGIEGSLLALLEQISLQGADLAQGVWMVEGQQVLGRVAVRVPIDDRQALPDRVDVGRTQPGLDENRC